MSIAQNGAVPDQDALARALTAAALKTGGASLSSAQTAAGAAVAALSSDESTLLDSSLGTPIALKTFDVYQNIVRTSFPKWSAAKVRSNNPARHLWYGDSNIAGEGSGTGTIGLDGAYLTGIVHYFSTLAGQQDLGLFGDQNISTGSELLNVYDPRWTFGSGWQQDTGTSCMGGRFLTGTAASSGQLSFAIGALCDTIDFYYPAASTANTALTVYIDGGLIDTINQTTGYSALMKKTYTVSNSVNHTISFGVGATGTGFVAGVQPYMKASTTPVAYRGAWCGGTIANLDDTTHPWGSYYGAQLVAPDFVSLYCTINDSKAPTAVNSYRASMEAVVAMLSATADGCLFVGYPTATGSGTTNGLLEQYKQALASVARDYGWALFDSRAVFGGSNTICTTRGLRYDNDHPNLTGHQALATAYYNWLKTQGY